MLDAGGSTSRRKTRIIALQVLYETDATGHDPFLVLERRRDGGELSFAGYTFAASLIRGVLENYEEIDKIITRFAPEWPVDQMAVVDRNVLRMAIYEVMLGGNTPPRVAVNEAVELAKVFGADNSSRFVNGVLGSVMESTKQQNNR